MRSSRERVLSHGRAADRPAPATGSETPWQLAELRPGSVPPPAAAVSFTAETELGAPAGAAPAVFEVAGPSAVPEQLLAPARAAAQAAGYAAGWASGVRAARLVADAEAHVAAAARERAAATQRAELDRALSTLAGAAHSLEQRAVPAAEQLEQLIVASAFSIAEALIGHALGDDTTRGHAAITRALALAPSGEDVTVALHPADLAALGADAAPLQRDGRTVRLVADPTLAPGDAVATCAATTIDARVATGLARVRDALAL